MAKTWFQVYVEWEKFVTDIPNTKIQFSPQTDILIIGYKANEILNNLSQQWWSIEHRYPMADFLKDLAKRWSLNTNNTNLIKRVFDIIDRKKTESYERIGPDFEAHITEVFMNRGEPEIDWLTRMN